jgi:uncharacterized membrane protein HdeD (DUF308 family)
MKKITYYFLMFIGVLAIVSGLYFMFQGKNLSIFYYSILIGVVLIATTYYNNKRKNKKE